MTTEQTEQIAKLKELESKAVQGPWKEWAGQLGYSPTGIKDDPGEIMVCQFFMVLQSVDPETATRLNHSRVFVRELRNTALPLIEALQARVSTLEEALRKVSAETFCSIAGEIAERALSPIETEGER